MQCFHDYYEEALNTYTLFVEATDTEQSKEEERGREDI